MNRNILLATSAYAVLIACAYGYMHWKSDNDSIGAPPRSEAASMSPLPFDKSAAANGHEASSPTKGSNGSLQKFLTAKASAEAGSAVAQRELAEMYGRCIPVNINPSRFLRSIDAIAALSKSPANAEGMKRVARVTVDECASVDNGAIIPLEAHDLWLQQAAKQGDLAAQAQAFMGSGKRPQGDNLRKFMDQVVASNDPAAMFEMGQLVVGNPSGDGAGRYSSVAGDTLSGYAWSIVACQRGLDCGAGSPIMNSACLNTGGCSSPDFESFVRDHLVTAGDAVLLNSRIEEVGSLLPNSN